MLQTEEGEKYMRKKETEIEYAHGQKQAAS